MLPSSRPIRLLAIAIAVLFALLPTGAFARSARHHGPVAHAAKAHKRARCHAKTRKHGKRVSHCAKAHKSSHKRAHASRARRHKTLVAPISSPTPPTSAPGNPGDPGDPTGPVTAPALTITGTTYYVSASGSDSNSGTSPGSAWQTVKRVNRASLRPGDGVLFEGGATFSDETLMPSVSGASGSPVIFSSYGSGNALLPQGEWFRGHSHLAFAHLTTSGGGFQGTGEDITVEWCTFVNDALAINAAGSNSNWTIDDNTIEHTGNSGMLLEGENFTVSGNTIGNTGLDDSISYGKHGIYLKVSNATVTNNTITNSSADGISVRYRNSTIVKNYIQGGEVGIAWFQYDPTPGTSRWLENTIVGTSEAGFYVSPSDIGGSTRESFVIERNTIEPGGGVLMNLHETTGTYTVQENS